MKTYLAFFSLALGCFSCKEEIDPQTIIGHWQESHEARYKDENGNYEEWKPMSITTQRNILSFTNDGRILHNYQAPTGCCSVRRFSVNKKQVLGYDIVQCATAFCSPTAEWDVLKLKNDELILEFTGNTQKRFQRIK